MALGLSYTTPTECDALIVNWIGGQPPFQLMVISVSNSEVLYDIPENAFNATTGSWDFTFPLAVAQDEQIIITVFDASGSGVNGATPLLTVGASEGGICNTNTSDPFQFDILGGMQQCANVTVSGYEGAVQPVSLYYSVPGDQTYIRTPPVNSSSYTMVLELPADTNVVLTMVDSLGHSGGSSGVLSVQQSNDTRCLDSPSSIPEVPSSTESTSGQSTASSTLGSPSSTTPLTLSTAMTPPVQIQISKTSSPTSLGPTSPPVISGATRASHTGTIAFLVIGAVIALMVAIILFSRGRTRKKEAEARRHTRRRQRGQKIESIHSTISESLPSSLDGRDTLARPYWLPSTSSSSRSPRSASQHRENRRLRMSMEWNTSEESDVSSTPSLPLPTRVDIRSTRSADRFAQLRALVREPSRRFRATTRTSQRSRTARIYDEAPPTPEMPPPPYSRTVAATPHPSGSLC